MRCEYTFGFLGPRCTAHVRRTWNRLLLREGIDGFFDFYRTTTPRDLETRLSEMFLLGRRGYLVHESLHDAAVSLMDETSISAKKSGKVDTVLNERGVLTGYFMGNASPETILALWMRK